MPCSVCPENEVQPIRAPTASDRAAVRMGVCGSSSKVKMGPITHVYSVVGPPGSVKTGLCEKLQAHGFSQITLGEAQRRAVRKNDQLGPEVKDALDKKVAADKAARKEGNDISEGWAGSDELNASVLEWLFRYSVFV